MIPFLGLAATKRSALHPSTTPDQYLPAAKCVQSARALGYQRKAKLASHSLYDLLLGRDVLHRRDGQPKVD